MIEQVQDLVEYCQQRGYAINSFHIGKFYSICISVDGKDMLKRAYSYSVLSHKIMEATNV